MDVLFASRWRLLEADGTAMLRTVPLLRVDCRPFSLSDIEVSGEGDGFAVLSLKEARAMLIRNLRG